MDLDAEGDAVSCQGTPGNPTNCNAPFYAIPGTPFKLLVRAGSIPAGRYGGFNSDLLMGGLMVTSRTCLAEVMWPSNFLCQQVDSTPPSPQQKAHGSRSGLFPPFALSNYGGVLVELLASCPHAGQFTVVLAAFDSVQRQAGATYVDSYDTPLAIATVGSQALDTDGDTFPDTAAKFYLADVLTINCETVPAETPTATPTPAPPVGGVALDAPSSGSGVFDSWWLVASAGTAFVALGGAAPYLRRVR